MTPESIRQRSDLIGTQVITRDTGNRLGIISQLWVDIDRREVIGFGVKDNILSVSALPRFMALDCISQIGDVILVEDERAIEDAVDVEPYSRVVGSEVITETGEPLGKVRGFKFDVEDGAVTAILVASLGLPQVPEQLISTYELPIDEVVSSGPDRLIVFEGAEDRLVQLSVGVLERLGISAPPWEREDEDLYFTPTAAPSNQLGTGLRQEAVRSQRMEGYGEEAWQEEEAWGDRRTRQRQPEYYAEEENWVEGREPQRSRQPEYDEVPADAWDEEPEYQAPKLNIPEKTRQPEYEEGGY
ncbi:MAG: PRC-barrel domain-containing protein [Cyanophyceae cyanobacterium]